MNIQRHAWAPRASCSAAPPATAWSTASESRATKMPSTMAICCSDASDPRMRAGAISAM